LEIELTLKWICVSGRLVVAVGWLLN